MKATEYAAWLEQCAEDVPAPCDDGFDKRLRAIAAELRRLAAVEQERDEVLEKWQGIAGLLVGGGAIKAESLGHDFQKVLNDNRSDLYIDGHCTCEAGAAMRKG